MLRTLIDYSRLLLDSPWLMLLVFAVIVMPSGILLTPVLASKVKRAKAGPLAQGSMQGSKLIDAVAANHTQRLSFVRAKSSIITFVPSVGKVQ